MIMRLSRLVVLLHLSLCVLPVYGQTSPLQDSRSVTLLSKSLGAVGGLKAVRSVKDYVATGTITYHWEGKVVKGNATLRCRGSRQFRLDAQLPDGTRSWVVSNGSGQSKDTAGKISMIPYHNTISLEGLAFPYPTIAAASLNPTTHISAASELTLGGTQFEKVHIEPRGPDKHINKLFAADYFIDPSTLLVVGVHDDTHPQSDLGRNIPHAVYYGDYRMTPQGIRFPFTITETMNTETVWSMQIDKVVFNSGLSDADFRF